MILRVCVMAIVFFLLSLRPVWSQEAPATSAAAEKETPAAIQPPQLEPVFADDFSKDTRADYKVAGDVSWAPGSLTLAEGASIERAINGGPWAKGEGRRWNRVWSTSR